ncbi:peptidyl-prolyl cis-trans isomerase-like 4 isoform X1 [Acipenser ruthenus]|uniref:peptidyl-prolyl cis-trans isomerase-like 4 isoform X1 n=1 Tax=Acipenser ruthenus TaxID=7906 RepID=UPI002741A224|nr:peptidyl-prolyl cis-trans isomerase-like 4 isoform X1 [Acipenser ruthenus]XP_058879978.1 peptidyl-prolyl cis-trans isomerase-like 4 isoform X1 [Acipenser ruthenus]XP_058879979.1 peptidyl-prolyl cis-trans isomerase-like 4 isoform X1 [Acipenser ruthenus]XP_058879980.1 peptidyl-prolyl cis-trans isomerase-like 4 isoform X1 [Acipenser ruthenus]
MRLLWTWISCLSRISVVKSFKTGKPESLCYAFIEFEKEEDTEKVYFKMDNVLIDDWRIHGDFSLFRRLNGKGKHRRDSLENRYRDQVTMERKAERHCSRSRSRSQDNDNHKHNKSKGDGDRERRDRSQSPRKCKDKERSQHR